MMIQPELHAADVAPDDLPPLVLVWLCSWMGNGWNRLTRKHTIY